VTTSSETLYAQIARFVDRSPAGLLQLLVAAAQRRTFERIIACPTYPAPARTAGLADAVRHLREALSRPDTTISSFLARLYLSVRTLEYRKRSGQFFTAPQIAEWALSFDHPSRRDDVCDAGAGTAVFAEAIVRTSVQVRSYVGIENDPILTLCGAHVLESLGAPQTFKMWYSNFLLLQPNDFEGQGLRVPTFVIANPPFVRVHKLRGRARVLASLRSSLGITLSPLSGAGSYFLSRAAALAAYATRSTRVETPSARLLFFFPKEAAGAAHARHLREDLKRAHHWTWLQYPLSSARTGVDKDPSNALGLLFYFERNKGHNHETNAEYNGSPVRIRDFLEVKRGISTGCNEFFVLTEDEVRKRRIPRRFLRPVLPTRIPLRSSCFSESDWEELRLAGHPCWLITLPNCDLRDFDTPIREYLNEGIRRGLHATTTGKALRNWFSMRVPNKPPDLFVTYLFRGSPRFILNAAHVLHLTNILGGRFTPAIEDHAQQQLIVQALDQQAKTWMGMNSPGREYKGGLRKIEPRELSMLPVDPEIARLAIPDHRAPQPVASSLFD